MQVQPLQVLTTSYGAYYIMARAACQIHANLAIYRRGVGALPRQRHRESAALTWLTGDGQAPGMSFDQVLGDKEARSIVDQRPRSTRGGALIRLK